MSTQGARVLRLWERIGFSRQILIIAVSSFVVSSILISAIILQLLDRQSQAILLASQSEISAMVARRIDNSIAQRQKLLEDFTAQLVFEEGLRPIPELQQLLDSRNALHHFFNGGLVLLDATGRSIVDSPVVEGRTGIDFSDRPHVRKARSTKATVITRPLIGRGLKSPVFVIDSPILNRRQEVIGFLFGVTRLASDNLFRQIGGEMLGQTASHMVIEPNLGLFITASQPELAMQPIQDSSFIEIINRVQAGEMTGLFRDETGARSLFTSSRLEIMDWLVIHLLPQPALFDRLQSVLLKVSGWIVVFTLLIAVSATLLLRRHLLKLQKTSIQIEAMATGRETFALLPEGSHDEIGRLNRAFNGLYRKLQRHILDLEHGSQENARLSEVMAHHFQEPVRRLHTFAERLLQRSELATDEESQLALTFIQQQSSRLSLLTRDAQRYLSLDKAHVLTTGGVDTTQVITEVMHRYRQAHPLSIEMDSNLPQVAIARDIFRELLENLVENSIRFRHTERPLRIHISAQPLPGVDRARFRVADNGSGIAPEYRQQVFELFNRLVPNSVPGTGMGLALVRRIVHSSDGGVSIEDGMDGGIAVVFDLPIER